MNLTDKMAYLRGMVDGMELDLTTTKEGKVLGQLLDVMQEMTAYVTDLQTQVDELTEVCDLFDQDLGDLEDIVYEGAMTMLSPMMMKKSWKRMTRTV
ncbi:MAG: CD1247 N-terminal domain-containing protein [Ruminococcus callidus]